MIATGGSLKQARCFYHIISFDWRKDNTWKYVANKEEEKMDIIVPMHDGLLAQIAHCYVDKGRKTLRVVSCPLGGTNDSLKMMQHKA